MSQSIGEFPFESLSVPERIILVQKIWDSIAAERPTVVLTKSQGAELDRRVTEHEHDPDSVITWEEVKAAVRETT